MKTIEHLINKNVFYLGSNYEYFKHISRYFAVQRCKSVFISNKKEAMQSIDRELGNMRAISYSYHVIFDDHTNYMKSINRILKNREDPDMLFLGFKSEFEVDSESDRNPLIDATDEEVDTLINFYITNNIKTINLFVDKFKKLGKGTIASIVTDQSSNPLEQLFAEAVNTYLMTLKNQLDKEGYKNILVKIFYKKSKNISYDKFVQKFTNNLISKKSIINL
jgi:hypothetical protein